MAGNRAFVAKCYVCTNGKVAAVSIGGRSRDRLCCGSTAARSTNAAAALLLLTAPAQNGCQAASATFPWPCMCVRRGSAEFGMESLTHPWPPQ